MLRFLLLGASDCANPSAITKEQLKTWESQALITYLGESSEVRDHIGSCSCVVLPSYYKEGVPRVLLEAMSMGKPIITTNVSGCKECIKPPFASEGELLIGENGILIPPKDPTALAHALQALAALPRTQLLKMGEAGRQYAKERFDITRVIASYHNAIASYHRAPDLHKDAPTPTESIDSTKSKKSTQSKKARLAFVSNTAFAMLCFRRNVLESLHKAGYEIHIIAPLDSHVLALRKCGFATHHIALKSSKQVWFLNPDDKAQFLESNLITPAQAFLLDSEGVDTHYFSPHNRTHKTHTSSTQALDSAHSTATSSIAESSAITPNAIAHSARDFRFLLIARMLWDKGVGEFVQAAKILLDSNKGGGYRHKPLMWCRFT